MQEGSGASPSSQRCRELRQQADRRRRRFVRGGLAPPDRLHVRPLRRESAAAAPPPAVSCCVSAGVSPPRCPRGPKEIAHTLSLTRTPCGPPREHYKPYCCQLLLPPVVAAYCCHRLLPPAVAACCCRLLLPPAKRPLSPGHRAGRRRSTTRRCRGRPGPGTPLRSHVRLVRFRPRVAQPKRRHVGRAGGLDRLKSAATARQH